MYIHEDDQRPEGYWTYPWAPFKSATRPEPEYMRLESGVLTGKILDLDDELDALAEKVVDLLRVLDVPICKEILNRAANRLDLEQMKGK